jgi:hypothetical protein
MKDPGTCSSCKNQNTNNEIYKIDTVKLFVKLNNHKYTHGGYLNVGVSVFREKSVPHQKCLFVICNIYARIQLWIVHLLVLLFCLIAVAYFSP